MTDEMVLVPRAELLAWAKAWQNDYDPNDGTDCVTPFDAYLLKSPVNARPVGKVSKDTGLTVTLERLPYYTGTRLAKGTELYAHPPPSSPVGVEAALRDALQGLIDFIEIDNLPMDADAMFIAKRALAQQPAADTVTVQQAWEWAGGNPGIKATRTDLEQALRDLDAVCDAADTQPTPPAQGFDAEVMWTDAHALLARFVDALNVRGNMLTCDHDRLTALDADARKLITAAAKGVE